MALVDFRGFRLVAMSLLPIGKHSIVYGSHNAGVEVFNSEYDSFSPCRPAFEANMKDLAQKLNLRDHLCGMTHEVAKTLWGCCDIEGHNGKDGRFYLLDYARLFPTACHNGPQGSQLFQLLRPEFVAKNPVPLTSDLFVRFATIHKGYKELADDVCEATKRLLTEETKRYVYSC